MTALEIAGRLGLVLTTDGSQVRYAWRCESPDCRISGYGQTQEDALDDFWRVFCKLDDAMGDLLEKRLQVERETNE